MADWNLGDTIGTGIMIVVMALLGVAIGETFGMILVAGAGVIFVLWVVRFFAEGMAEGVDTSQESQ